MRRDGGEGTHGREAGGRTGRRAGPPVREGEASRKCKGGGLATGDEARTGRQQRNGGEEADDGSDAAAATTTPTSTGRTTRAR